MRVLLTQVRDVLGDGRLIKCRIRDGRGEFPMDCPLQDSLLRVHYKGLLLNEEKTVFFDTKFNNNGQPLEFSSGEGLVPQGFEMCVRLMLPGEIALVTWPPDYAYDKFERLGGQLMFLKVLTCSGKLSFLTLTHRRTGLVSVSEKLWKM
ncbi:peptidyl-prolyl cis-trans isomerase PASTICCINO1-like isoform X2 [Nicotiana tabacum]|uniref:Peptidyl-prolyl cis-trans isomerase PASTICCINO1-like isoform X2 n=1 Tax=Nicotiana tabacum TaxID=4097 RepID=A0AC58U5G1_TOBAC